MNSGQDPTSPETSAAGQPKKLAAEEINEDDLTDLATVAAEFMVTGSLKFAPWSDRMMNVLGDLVRGVAEDLNSTPEQVLRIAHEYGSVLAEARGFKPEPVPPEIHTTENGIDRPQLEHGPGLSGQPQPSSGESEPEPIDSPQFWQDTANSLPPHEDELAQSFQTKYFGLLESIEGHGSGVPADASQTATTYFEKQDWDELYNFLYHTFMQAASSANEHFAYSGDEEPGEDDKEGTVKSKGKQDVAPPKVATGVAKLRADIMRVVAPIVMSTRQRWIVWGWTAAITAASVYPPWHYNYSGRGPYGYHLLFLPPAKPISVDILRLTVEWISISVIAACLYFTGSAGSTKR